MYCLLLNTYLIQTVNNYHGLKYVQKPYINVMYCLLNGRGIACTKRCSEAVTLGWKL